MSSVSSSWSVKELSIEIVAFGESGIYLCNDNYNSWYRNLNDFPIFVAAKHYGSLGQNERNALHLSLSKVWNAYLVSGMFFDGPHNCANILGIVEESYRMEFGDDLLVRLSSSRTVKGRNSGPHPDFPHLTSIDADSGSDELSLSPGTNI